MAIIDADAGILETEHTWDYLDPSSEIDAILVLQENRNLRPSVIENILSSNPAALYGL